MRILCSTIFMLLALALAGCASTADSGNLVPDRVTAMGRHDATVSLNVTGGEAGEDADLTDAKLRDALHMAIGETRIFSAVASRSMADYHLDVHVKHVRTQPASTRVTATMLSEWSLTDAEGNELWRDTLSRQHQVGFYDHVLPQERERLAREGAVRDSLEAGLARAARLELP